MRKDEKKLKEEVQEVTEKWKRALADYQNLERRISEEKEEFVKFANASLLVRILVVADSLEKAEEHLKDEGLSLILRNFFQVLSEEGLEKIEVLGKKFDPNEMECVELIKGEEEIVTGELRKGYRLKGKVIRVAQVKVGQGEKG